LYRLIEIPEVGFVGTVTRNTVLYASVGSPPRFVMCSGAVPSNKEVRIVCTQLME
jgi:hypothetical protein